MSATVTRTIIYALLVLEAANSGLWIWRLLPSLAVRDWTTILLVTLRAAASSLQLVGAMLLRTGRITGPDMARGGVALSALLLPFEIGWRLAPTNMEPTYRWWVVFGYWVYAGVVWVALRRRG